MKTAVTKRGQTVVPSAFRKKYSIHENSYIQWIDTGESIKIVPVPDDVVGALRGIARGENLVDQLLEERKHDQRKE